MNFSLTIHPVGIIHTPYKQKFGIPRQSSLSMNTVSYITLEGDFKNPDCIRGIEEYSHLWLLWNFSGNNPQKWSPTVRPPRLGGNIRKGVFATRSPFRPNPIGLSCVKIDHIEYSATLGPILYVLGADLMDGTPIYDIKPYIPYTDSHPEASYQFAKEGLEHRLTVCDPNNLLSCFSDSERSGLLDSLALDPRPSYHDDSERVYGMFYGAYNVRFRVEDHSLYILDIKKGPTL